MKMEEFLKKEEKSHLWVNCNLCVRPPIRISWGRGKFGDFGKGTRQLCAKDRENNKQNRQGHPWQLHPPWVNSRLAVRACVVVILQAHNLNVTVLVIIATACCKYFLKVP